MNDVLIVGAGGLGREVYSYLCDRSPAQPAVRIKGFLDDRLDALDGFTGISHRILGTIATHQPQPNERFVLALGDCALRKRIGDLLENKGARFISVVHHTAWIAPTSQLGDGCVICPFAFLSSHTRVGRHAVINTYASAGHDAKIGDYSVLSPYAVVNGGVDLQEGVFMGTHSTVIPGRRIGSWSKIGANSVALKDAPAGSLIVGAKPTVRQAYAPER